MSTSHKGFPNIFMYLYVQHIPPQTLLLGVVAGPVNHPAYGSTCLKIKLNVRLTWALWGRCTLL